VTNEDLTAPKITAILPWYGSKRNIAPTIVEELGEHRVYWSPFCGSLAVEFEKPVCVMETVCDLHGDLINLARVLRNESDAIDLYGRLARVVFHEALFEEVRERCLTRRESPAPILQNVDHAEDFMICSWFGRNGVAGTANNRQGFCVRYTANGGHAATRWSSVVDSIPAWHHRLRNITIINRDAFTVLEKIEDTKGTAIYSDSPYIVKSAPYIHDFRLTIPDHPEPLCRKYGDHGRLALALKRFKKARCVVSYYDHPALAELYPGWSRREIVVTKSLASQGKRAQSSDIRATEVLLVNGPLFGKTAGSKQTSFFIMHD
jgi:DNA adenine methylase